MSKFSFAAVFAIGLLVVGWIALGFAGGSWLPLLVTVVILAVYLLGAYELRQLRASTAGLRAALDALAQPPASLADWLAKVPASLRGAVRSRIEGERGVLPGPALTPYLVGLLVMLGMLGTFLGMVVTFKGAVFALEGSTDLQAIRAALAEPVRGLGLSFGASVAGVAASAMLGLMSAIARRERLEVARLLDARVAGALQPFTQAHQRQETLRTLQEQARAMPQVVEALQAMLERIEARSQQLDREVLERQAQFQRETTLAYTELARTVGASLQEHLAGGARAAGEAIRPVVETAMAQVVQETRGLHERLATSAQLQVDGFTRSFEERSAGLLSALQDNVARTGAEQARRDQAQEQRMEHLVQQWNASLATLRADEDRRGEAAVARLTDLQAAVAQHLATLGAALEAPITRLLHTASEVPQAAAGVIAQLREEMSRVAERDNLALQERTVILERLGALLQSVNAAAGEQRTATEALVASATSVLEQAGSRFTEALAAQAGHAAESATQIASTSVELAGVAEAFGRGVQQFQASNDGMIASLQRIEAALQRSTARSDEQLAYYVAQAREVIDLSIASQQGVVESLRELQAPRGKPVAEGAPA